MKKYCFFRATLSLMTAALVMSSCAKEANIPEGSDTTGSVTIPYTVTVSVEPETRATVDSDWKTLRFAEGDKLYISGLGSKIQGVLDIQTGVGETSGATFSGNLTCPVSVSEDTNDLVFAMLVNGQQEVSVNESGIVNMNYPHNEYCATVEEAVQRYSLLGGWAAFKKKSFTLSQTTTFLNFEITVDDGTAGTEIPAEVTINQEKGPYCTANVITKEEDGKVVARFVLPIGASEIAKDPSVKLGEWAPMPFGEGLSVLYGKVYNVKRLVGPVATPLTVEALTAGTVKVNIIGEFSTGMKYAVNGGEKTLITSTTKIPVNAGDKVQFYGNGTSTQRYYPSLDQGVKIQGEGTGFTCKAYGNIMSLLDEKNFATKTDLPTSYHDCFRELFLNNTALTDAGDLLLPAPALTLSANCYRSMFQGCTALTTAPALPAETLVDGCYYGMFWGCTALTEAPALPATTLAESCYLFMFRGCTALTKAPELLAPTLVNSCYLCMFDGCTKLNYVKCLATSGFDEQNTYEWLDGVAATGTFAADNDATWPVNSKHGIPSGWTRRDPDGKAISHALSSAVVGEIVGSDGKAYAASDKDLLPSGVSAVAIVAYLGSAGSVETGTNYRGLAIAMSEANSSSGCRWYTSDGGHCVSQTNDLATAKGYLNGIACTETLVNSNGSGVTTNCIGHTHAAAIAARSNNGTTAPTGCSNWFLPSMGQWQLILQGLTGKSGSYKREDINPKITAAGGTINVHLCLYWSSTEYNNDNTWYMDLENGWMPYRPKVDGPFVRAALAF